MPNADLKTKKTTQSVSRFIDDIEDEGRREDCRRVLDLMMKATGAEPKMWGESVVGFGDYHYRYDSGRENDWFVTGFSPRKQNLTLYFMTGLDRYESLLKRLGKHKTGKGCLYIRNLDDIDIGVLRELVTTSARDLLKPKSK